MLPIESSPRRLGRHGCEEEVLKKEDGEVRREDGEEGADQQKEGDRDRPLESSQKRQESAEEENLEAVKMDERSQALKIASVRNPTGR